MEHIRNMCMQGERNRSFTWQGILNSIQNGFGNILTGGLGERVRESDTICVRIKYFLSGFESV